MFKIGSRVKVANSSLVPVNVAGKSGIVTKSIVNENYSVVNFIGNEYKVLNVHLTPVALTLEQGGFCDPKEGPVKSPDLLPSLTHSLVIGSHTHTLTTKQVKDLKNVLAAIV